MGGLQRLVCILRTGNDKPSNSLYDEYSCVGAGGYLYTSPIADAVIATVDAEKFCAPQASYTRITNPDNGNSFVAYTSHCDGNEPCSAGEVGPEPVDDALEQSFSHN